VTGISNKLAYKSAADLRAKYPKFFWQMVQPYIVDGLRYLRVTQEGQQWVANLYANVFLTEHWGADSLVRSIVFLLKIVSRVTCQAFVMFSMRHVL